MAAIDQLRLKTERAKKHIADLDFAIATFRNSRPYEVRTNENHQARKCEWILDRLDPIPDKISILAGDALQNLRTTLDHLAWQLVLANGQMPNKGIGGTCFPISDSSQQHASAIKGGKVKGMSTTAIQAIDELHPYRGGWERLWQLHSLNNIDKHRLLLSAGSGVVWRNLLPSEREEITKIYFGSHPNETIGPNLDGVGTRPPDAMFPLEVGKVFLSIPKSEMKNDFTFRLGIAFNEPDCGVVGESVLDTLVQFSGCVDRIINISAPML